MPFFNTTQFEMNGETFGPRFGSPVAGRAFPAGYFGQAAFAQPAGGLIFHFGAPAIVEDIPPPIVAPVEVAPPPPPEPVVQQPVPAGPFIVFFDWDRSDITPEAASILDNAAAAYQQTGSANVMLAGNADKSGSDSYNVGLSQRRADARFAPPHSAARHPRRHDLDRSLWRKPATPGRHRRRRSRAARTATMQITFGPSSGM